MTKLKLKSDGFSGETGLSLRKKANMSITKHAFVH